MENYLLTKQSILENLEYLPNNKLKEVNNFIQFLLQKTNSNKVTENKSLAGIWENIGFEKIVNFDEEINDIRKELSDNILDKKI